MAEERYQLKKFTPGDIAGRGIAPVFANRFQAVMQSPVLRIAFGELVVGNPDTDTDYHTVVAMPLEDAKALANLILRVLGKVSPDETDDA